MRRALSLSDRGTLVSRGPLAYRFEESLAQSESDGHDGQVESVQQAGVEELSNLSARGSYAPCSRIKIPTQRPCC